MYANQTTAAAHRCLTLTTEWINRQMCQQESKERRKETKLGRQDGNGERKLLGVFSIGSNSWYHLHNTHQKSFSRAACQSMMKKKKKTLIQNTVH